MSFRSPAHLGGVKFRRTQDAPFELVTTIEIPANRALATTDRLRLFQLGAGTQVIELTIRTDKLDTAGVPAITLNAGFESHNTAVQASNLTAYASASTVGQAGGTAKFDPVTAAPLADYTLTVSPGAAAGAAATVDTRLTVAAKVVGPNVPTGLLGSGLGAAYDHGRADPVV